MAERSESVAARRANGRMHWFLRLMLLLEFAGLAGCVLALQRDSWPLWLGVPLMILIWLAWRAIPPLVSILWARAVTRNPAAWRALGPGAALRYVVGEIRAWIRAWGWLQLWPRKRGRRIERRCQVLLIHGFCCNSGLFRPLIRDLRRNHDVSAQTVDLDPLFRDPEPALAATRDALDRCTGAPVVLVGFSMGGVVARILTQSDPGRAVAGLISVGTPFAKPPTVIEGMSRGPARWWSRSEQATGHPAPVIRRIDSDTDNVAVDSAAFDMPRAEQILVTGYGHMQLILHPRMRDLICKQIVELLEAAG